MKYDLRKPTVWAVKLGICVGIFYIAPEVPQDFHEKFEETLRHIEQADAVNKKYKRKRDFDGKLQQL